MTGAQLLKATEREIARRARAAGNSARTFTAALLCHAKQSAFVRAVLEFRNVTVCAGRQSGKSHAAVAAGIEMCLSRPDVAVLYVAATRASVKRMAWKSALKFNTEHNLGGVPNYTDLSLTFPNGSVLELVGVDTEKAADRIRGIQRLIAAFVDEMSLYRQEVATALLRDSIRPALRPMRGKLVLMGTPGKLGKVGPWWEAIQRSEHHFEWTVYDTVGIVIDGVPVTLEDIEATIQEDLAAEKQTKESAWFRIEYLAIWDVDVSLRAYRFSDEENVYDELPGGLCHAVSFGDIGVRDEDAFGSLKWGDSDPTMYLVEREIRAGLTTDDEKIILARINEDDRPIEMVIDTGGQGAKTFITVQTAMPHLPLVAARKPEVNIQVKLLNNALEGGWLKVKRGSRFAADVRKATWLNGIVNGKLMEDGIAKSNIVPGVRYGVIHAIPYLPPRPLIGPAQGEVIDPAVAEMVARRERHRELSAVGDLNYDPYR